LNQEGLLVDDIVVDISLADDDSALGVLALTDFLHCAVVAA
jgi:hypothetical protein